MALRPCRRVRRTKASDKAYGEIDAIAALNDTADFRSYICWRCAGAGAAVDCTASGLGPRRQAEGDVETAIKRFEAGASLQDTINYMEPPYWYYPIRQSLGAAYLAAGRTDDALQAFKASLITAPNNAWSLYGLEQAYKVKGDTAAAGYTADLLENAWIDRGAELNLDQL